MATVAVTNIRRKGGITPEIYFHKPIDNSRLVKVADPQRKRDMMMFSGTLGLVLVLFLVFCIQHYSAIEYGYQNAALREKCQKLLETRRQLHLDEAQLREPWRIDDLARQMGLQPPMAGQVVNLDTSPANAGGTVMAQVAAISVISATQ
jgi:hypothetical protein